MTNKEMFLTCTVNKPDEVDALIDKILAHKARYQAVAQKNGVPWYFIAVLHVLETGLQFDKHLHNGDPLSGRTKKVPAGRPKKGEPPFTWEESAIDALEHMKFTSSGASRLSWGVSALLDRMERYNGPGYKNKGLPSPYLWAGSQFYKKGKFVKDGVYDPNAVSEQIGGAVILVRMMDRGLIQL